MKTEQSCSHRNNGGLIQSLLSGRNAPTADHRSISRRAKSRNAGPRFCPASKAVLFTSSTHQGNYEDADIVVYSMVSGQRKTVQRGGSMPAICPAGTSSICTKARCLPCPSI